MVFNIGPCNAEALLTWYQWKQVNIVVADVVISNWYQAIDHHHELTMSSVPETIHVALHLLEKLQSSPRGQSQDLVSLNSMHVIFKLNLVIDDGGVLWNCPPVIVTVPHWWLVIIGSGKGTKPLKAPSHYWTNADPVLCWHMASLGHTELIIFSAGKAHFEIEMSCFIYRKSHSLLRI